MSTKQVIVMFGEGKLALSREIKNHPKLAEILLKYDLEEQFSEILAIIAAYCGIGVNEVFLPDELDKFCGELYQELVDKRAIIINTTSTPNSIIH